MTNERLTSVTVAVSLQPVNEAPTSAKAGAMNPFPVQDSKGTVITPTEVIYLLYLWY